MSKPDSSDIGCLLIIILIVLFSTCNAVDSVHNHIENLEKQINELRIEP